MQMQNDYGEDAQYIDHNSEILDSSKKVDNEGGTEVTLV